MKGKMNNLLATSKFASWEVTELLNSLRSELPKDTKCHTLRMYFYAISSRGWQEVRGVITRWRAAKSGRRVVAYVGTDHGLTDAAAMEQMDREHIEVRLMMRYQGIFHPKVFWLEGKNTNLIWVGSNNLTRDGLINNIEFAVAIRSERTAMESLVRWSEQIELASDNFSNELLSSYKNELGKYQRNLSTTQKRTFTWSKKREPLLASGNRLGPGDLVLEIMPQETRGGNQVQIPIAAASVFFGVSGVGHSKLIRLRCAGNPDTRELLVTVFENNTVRISLNELEQGDRPCVIHFRKLKGGTIEFEIVPESIFPARYQQLLLACGQQTRKGSLRWTILPKLARRSR